MRKSVERKLTGAKRSGRANLIESSAPTINPVSEQSSMGMGFEEDVSYDQIDHIDQIDQDLGQNVADRNYYDGQEDCEDVNIQDDLRDTNNNSSSTLFSEAEILGRGRGLVAKVRLVIITIWIIIMIMIMMITMPPS